MNNREEKRIRQLAKLYKRLGYKIYCRLPGYEVPSKVNGIIPDLVVKKGRQIIILEVESTESLKSKISSIKKLAQYAERTQHSRFDLVMTNPTRQVSHHIIPHGNGWAVKGSNRTKYSAITATKDEAEQIAKQIAMNQKSQVVIHGRDGKILDRQSYSVSRAPKVGRR